MALSKNIISNFAKITNDTKQTTKETITYGKVSKIRNGVCYVKINGSDIETPASFTSNINTNDTVTVMIKNHKAIITGNKTETANEPKGSILNDTSSLAIMSAEDEYL